MNDTLLCECTGWAEMTINETSTLNGRVIFRGKFQEANAVNKNKRMYPFDVLSQNVERLMETVKHNGLTGELDHPSDSIIHFRDASHLITDLYWEGNVLMGEGKVLNTPSGFILQQLMKDGVRVGISSRGVGNGQVNNEGVLVIGESYKLITFDAVADPSTHFAFQERVTKPSKKDEGYTPTIFTKSSSKNETTSVHNVHSDVWASYLGQLISGYTDKWNSKAKK